MHARPQRSRSSNRIPIVLPVYLELPEGDIAMVQTENISVGGMLLQSPAFVAPHRRLALRFAIPGQERQLRATAQVRFIGPSSEGYALGVQIIAMAAEDWQVWQRWCQRLAPTVSPPERPDGQAARSSAHILVLSSALSSPMLATLVASGHRLNLASDMSTALSTLRTGCDCEILICELRRKDMDGLTLCNLLKQERSLHDVHVILIDEYDAAKDLQAGFAVGATYVIARPFSDEFLLSLITLCQRG